MPTLHVPSRGGGLRAHSVRAGKTLADALREMGLLGVGAQRGLEMKTAEGWTKVSTARVLREGDVVRMRQPSAAGSEPAGERLAVIVQTIMSALKRKKVVPGGVARSGLRRRRGARPGSRGTTRPPRK